MARVELLRVAELRAAVVRSAKAGRAAKAKAEPPVAAAAAAAAADEEERAAATVARPETRARGSWCATSSR